MQNGRQLIVLAVLLCIGPAAQDPPATGKEPPPVQPSVPGQPARHPLEGVYVLRERVVEGKTIPGPHTGFLAITRKHFFLSMLAPGTRPGRLLLRSGVREWEPMPDTVRTVIKLEAFTDTSGDLQFETAGTVQIRRVQSVQGGVRVNQDDRSWLEFERVE